MSLRVLMTKKFFEEDLNYLQSGLNSGIELISPETFTPEGVLSEVSRQEIHVLLGDMATAEILDAATCLRLIQIPWTGVDRLNRELLGRYPVPICNSHSNSLAVAEMSVGLMLAVMKKIPLHDARLRQGNWMRPQRGVPDSHQPPTGLSGKTVGFVGFGAIAQNIAELLSGFRVKTVATVANPDRPRQSSVDELLPASKLSELAEKSDLIFVAVPLVSATRGLINQEFFSRMKSSAYLVNVSRGEIIDEESLYNALKNREIAGAGIDTWYQYPSANQPQAHPSSRFPFHELDNLVLSPHRAGFAEGDLPHLADVVENLNRLAEGKSLINQIDLQQGF